MRTAGAVVLGLVLAIPAYGAQKIKIMPVQLVETRAKQFKKKVKFPSTSELKLTIHVEGDQVNDATSYGKIKFDEAADDAGTDLKPKKAKGMSSFGGSDDEFKPLRSGMMGMRQEEDEKGFRLELSLGLPSRKAILISRLKGEFQVLAGGTEKTVTIKKPKNLIGKKVEDPVLEAAGLEARILDPKKKKGGWFSMGGENSLSIELKGDLKAVQKMDVIDAKGKSLTSGHMSMGDHKKKTYSYDLDKPLDDTTTLKIELLVGLKTITVPLDLKDLELP